MVMNQPTKRWTLQETQAGVQVVLPSKKRFFTLLWVIFWLLAWGYATGHVVYLWAIMTFGSTLDLLNIPPLDDEGVNYALLLGMVCIFPFLVILLGMGGIGTYSFLWQLAGKEIIEVNNENLAITRQIFNWRTTKEYPLKTAIELRLNSKKPNSIDTIRGIRKLLGKDGIIALDYEAKTFCFGLEIDKTEAKEIISEIQKHLPNQNTG
jgi:hypothetical protein